jgi:hypothetical protein
MTNNRVEEMRTFLLQQKNPASQLTSNNPHADEQAKLESEIGVGSPSRSQSVVSKTDRVAQGINEGLQQAGQSAIGAGKGILNTINNVSKLGQKALQTITGVKSKTASLPQKAVTPTEAQKPGFVGEQIGEFFAPSSFTSKLTNTLNIVAEGSKLSKVGQVAVKAVGKAGIEGGAAATVRLGQTASGKEAVKAGATAGVMAGTASAVGDALRAARVPEWFYSKIYHNTSDDMLQELKTVGTANLQKTNPQLYKQLVGSGVIKLDKVGQPVLNETLAKEALDRGLKGSIKNMANEVVKNTYELEDTAQHLTKASREVIKLHPNYTATLQEIAGDYKNVGLGSQSKMADELLGQIQDNTTTPENALKIRRFLDGMRVKSSYNPGAKPTQQQAHFKELTDNLRQQLAKEVPGLKPVMNEYRFNIEALNALAKEANRRGNREVIGLIDTVFFGSGIASGNPAVGATLGVARRLINSPAGTTKVGQGINQLGKGTSKSGALLRGAAAYSSSKATQNNQ